MVEIFGEPIGSGGQESYVMSQLASMDRNGLAFDLLTPYDCENEVYANTIRSWGGNVYSFGLTHNPGRSREGIREPLDAFLREHGYDVAHVHSGSTSALAICARAAKKAGVKAVLVHSHSPIVDLSLPKRANRFLSGLRMKGCVDCYCACSETAAEAKYISRVIPDVVYLKNGIDLEKYSYSASKRASVRKELGVRDDQVVLGHVGRMALPKNQSYLVDIFAKYQSFNPGSVLWLIGDGPDMEIIKDKVTSLGLEDSVQLLGARSNVNDYLQGMDIFVFPSFFEGLSIAYLEAATAGLPCLISSAIANGMNDEVVEAINSNGEFVRYVELGDIDAWIAGLVDFADKRNGDAVGLVRQAGYDSLDTAKALRDLYCSIAKQVTSELAGSFAAEDDKRIKPESRRMRDE